MLIVIRLGETKPSLPQPNKDCIFQETIEQIPTNQSYDERFDFVDVSRNIFSTCENLGTNDPRTVIFKGIKYIPLLSHHPINRKNKHIIEAAEAYNFNPYDWPTDPYELDYLLARLEKHYLSLLYAMTGLFDTQRFSFPLQKNIIQELDKYHIKNPDCRYLVRDWDSGTRDFYPPPPNDLDYPLGNKHNYFILRIIARAKPYLSGDKSTTLQFLLSPLGYNDYEEGLRSHYGLPEINP